MSVLRKLKFLPLCHAASGFDLCCGHPRPGLPLTHTSAFIQTMLLNTVCLGRAPTPTLLVSPWLVFPSSHLWMEPGAQEGLCGIPTLDTADLRLHSGGGLCRHSPQGGEIPKVIPQASLEES